MVSHNGLYRTMTYSHENTSFFRRDLSVSALGEHHLAVPHGPWNRLCHSCTHERDMHVPLEGPWYHQLGTPCCVLVALDCFISLIVTILHNVASLSVWKSFHFWNFCIFETFSCFTHFNKTKCVNQKKTFHLSKENGQKNKRRAIPWNAESLNRLIFHFYLSSLF